MPNKAGKTVEELAAIAAAAVRRHALPRLHFTVGVLNALLKAFALGAIPQKFWLYHAVQFLPLMVMVISNWRRKKQLLYFTELCWVINWAGWLFIMTEVATLLLDKPLMPMQLRVLFIRAFFCLANGPLATAVLMNSNALVFHDIERTASFFIHFSPALVSWTMRWQPAGSGMFAITYEQLQSAGSAGPSTPWELAWPSIAVYLCWWCLYSPWLLAIGCMLPERGWGRSSFADFRPILTKLGVPNKHLRLQALTYCIIHMLLCCLVLCTLPLIFYNYFWLHSGWLIVLILSAAKMGAGYYHHAFGKKLEKEIKAALEADQPTQLDPPHTHKE